MVLYSEYHKALLVCSHKIVSWIVIFNLCSSFHIVGSKKPFQLVSHKVEFNSFKSLYKQT